MIPPVFMRFTSMQHLQRPDTEVPEVFDFGDPEIGKRRKAVQQFSLLTTIEGLRDIKQGAKGIPFIGFTPHPDKIPGHFALTVFKDDDEGFHGTAAKFVNSQKRKPNNLNPFRRPMFNDMDLEEIDRRVSEIQTLWAELHSDGVKD